jgi:predicted AlkP superfamily phosphohydrolase/phosphomutase
LLVFYVSSVDQNSHMLWRYMDSEHPSHVDDEMLHDGIKIVYEELDEALGRVMGAIDDETTLVVMSDHGFSPFWWGVNLNTWLLEKGYVQLKDPSLQGRYEWFVNVDWSRTKAYAVGLNGLYLNLRGREKQGIVDPADYQALLDQLERDLLEMTDPRNGRNAVSLVVQSRRDFRGQHSGDGPDIIVGYNWGYRSSWESPLGRFPREVFVDNDKAWSGDHAIDYRLVPGVLISNRPITLDQPALYDLTVAILDEYGIAKPEEMIGRDCLGPAAAAGAQRPAPDEDPGDLAQGEGRSEQRPGRM